jgi:hypothetical protein
MNATSGPTPARHTSLVGWWFVEGSADHQSFRLGQIVGEVVGGMFYMITFQLAQGAEVTYPPPHEVISIVNLNEKCAHCGERLWDLFQTREDRDAYVLMNSQSPNAQPPGAQGAPPPKRVLN